MNGAATVVLDRVAYSPSDLGELLERMAPFLGIDQGLAGKQVVLKPNLISIRGPSFACTDSRFLVAVARWFVDSGAVVSVGDSPAFGSTEGVLKHIDAYEGLSRLGVKIVEFSSSRDVVLDCGVRVGLAVPALDCDLLVNLPKLKAHNQMLVTLAIKNIFGIVSGIQKPMLHMRHGGSHRSFAAIILDLLAFLPSHVTIVDGIEAMHVAGPLHGKPFALNCVAASKDPVAVDSALIAALELSPVRSPLWLEAKNRGDAGVRLSDITFPFLSPQDFFGSGFMAPDELSPVRFNPLRFIFRRLKRMGLAIRS